MFSYILSTPENGNISPHLKSYTGSLFASTYCIEYFCSLSLTYLAPFFHTLRSSGTYLLAVPSARLSTTEGRAFSVALPKLWNSPSISMPTPLFSILKLNLKPIFFASLLHPANDSIAFCHTVSPTV